MKYCGAVQDLSFVNIGRGRKNGGWYNSFGFFSKVDDSEHQKRRVYLDEYNDPYWAEGIELGDMAKEIFS